MIAPGIDPILPLIVRGRTLDMNNAMRAKLIFEAAISQKRDPEGFRLFVLHQLQFAQAEAVARDRAGQDGDPQLLPASETKLISVGVSP